jgi:hypothetical protein
MQYELGDLANQLGLLDTQNEASKAELDEKREIKEQTLQKIKQS